MIEIGARSRSTRCAGRYPRSTLVASGRCRGPRSSIRRPGGAARRSCCPTLEARAARGRRRGRTCRSSPARRRSSHARPPTTGTISSRAAATGSSPRSPASRPTPGAGSRSCPTGAGNDFARGLGYDPKHPLDAFAALAHGHDRVVDLGRVNGRWYTCVTASGFDAEANRWANTVHRLSGTTLYVAAVLRTLAVYKPHPFRLTVDGEAHEITAWLVAVGNGPAYARRHAHRARRASLDDGLLDVTVVGDDDAGCRSS